MSKKIGELHFVDETKTIWGDIYSGSEDSGVRWWGIAYWNLKHHIYNEYRGDIEDMVGAFNEAMDYRLKKKTKDDKYGKRVKFYIPRPVNKMNGVIDALKQFDGTDTCHVDITMDEFDPVKRHEMAKKL